MLNEIQQKRKGYAYAHHEKRAAIARALTGIADDAEDERPAKEALALYRMFLAGTMTAEEIVDVVLVGPRRQQADDATAKIHRIQRLRIRTAFLQIVQDKIAIRRNIRRRSSGKVIRRGSR
jgi:hypothetical protein